MNVIFANPYFLLLLIFIPIYIVFLFFNSNRVGFYIPVYEDLNNARKKSIYKYVPLVRHVFVILVIITSSIALARPQMTEQVQNITKKGIDIEIVLDVSDSMRAEDLKPNRLETAKKALRDFVATRETDRVGVVVFSGVPFTQSPLTFDYDILNTYIKNISTESIDQNAGGLGGTAIGDAILTALNRLKSEPERTKIIILISDGDANVGVDPKVAAYKAKELDVKIYTIGIGKKEGAPIPVTDAFGNQTVARNRDGSVYIATFNDVALREISDITGGMFVRAEDSTAFMNALDDIGKLEKTDIEVSNEIATEDSFWWYLVVAAICMGMYGLFEMFFLPKQ